MVAETQIGGGETEGPPAPVAAPHAGLHFPQMPQDRGGETRLPALEILARAGRGIDLAGVADGADHGDAEAPRGARRRQRRGVAGAAMTVAVVVTGDDAPHAEPGHENVGDEIVGRHGGEGAREALAEEIIRAAFAQPADPGAERREAPRRAFGPEDIRRVGFEREDAERGAVFARQFRGAADNPAMAQMHAVEIAHRNDGAAGSGRRARVIAANAHGAGL